MEHMNWHDHITTDPTILAGRPVAGAGRVAVEEILRALASGESIAAVVARFPALNEADVRACLEYASEIVAGMGSGPALTKEQEAGLLAGLDSIRAGRTVPLAEVLRRIDASLKR